MAMASCVGSRGVMQIQTQWFLNKKISGDIYVMMSDIGIAQPCCYFLIIYLQLVAII
jgi:hypothetical protein